MVYGIILGLNQYHIAFNVILEVRENCNCCVGWASRIVKWNVNEGSNECKSLLYERDCDFATVTMVRITGIEISNKPKYAKQTAISKSLKIRNFYSGDAHPANSGKHSLNHHFQHCAHSVYDIYSVFNFFEIAACFAHIDLYEMSLPVMRTMLTMANIA